MFIDRLTGKEDVVYIYIIILPSRKKEWKKAICSNMEATPDYHTKWSKSERKIPHDTTYMWNLQYGTNEPVSKQKIASQT